MVKKRLIIFGYRPLYQDSVQKALDLCLVSDGSDTTGPLDTASHSMGDWAIFKGLCYIFSLYFIESNHWHQCMKNPVKVEEASRIQQF